MQKERREVFQISSDDNSFDKEPKCLMQTLIYYQSIPKLFKDI